MSSVARTRVSLSGDRLLARQLAKMVAEAPEICTEALTEWGKDVEEGAEDRVPVRSGNLQDHIESRVDSKRLVAEVGVWEPGAYYSEFVEKGTSRQDAQPFLQPAFEEHRNIRPYVRDAVDKRWGT